MDASLGDFVHDDSEPVSEHESNDAIDCIEKAIRATGVEKSAEPQKSFGQMLKDLKEKQKSEASAMNVFGLDTSKQKSD